MLNNTILIVDDTPTNLDILLDLLDDYDVIDATSGADALEILEEEEIDLILLDIMMPDMNGYEVCEIVKNSARNKHIPIIFITAKTDDKSIEKAYEIGGIDYVIKPFRPIELKAKVSRELELLKSIKEVQKLNKSLSKQVETEVAKNRMKDQQIAKKERLAQMGEMISMIAHQWRQPLNSISLTSNNLSFKCMLDDIDRDEFSNELALIDKYSQHLSKTIDDFRNFFKEEKQKQMVSLDEIVNSTMSIVETSTNSKGISINTKLQSPEKFETFSNEIKQVILNLVNNSVDVLVEKNIKDPLIEIVTSHCELSISDNGGGIADEIIDKIFDPYFSTKKEKEGTGLGLYMSNIIIQEHCNASIKVKNNDLGACFSIRFGESK